ncbi:hypothetical protein RIF29_14901 [Crotalaria pallida]|uniref:Uncharacterized protein n=1 Tax=Crotalaria pallida TaxID=3830 RepID=A0AAN9FC45_CROPI
MENARKVAHAIPMTPKPNPSPSIIPIPPPTRIARALYSTSRALSVLASHLPSQFPTKQNAAIVPLISQPLHSPLPNSQRG